MPLPLKESEIGVSIILIPHNNCDRFKIRLERDLIQTIVAHPNWKFQIIIVDNSDVDKRPSYQLLEDNHLEHIVYWPGSNLMYGPAMNLALGVCIHPYVVYMCSNHGRMYDPTWIDDLVNPIIQDAKVAMTGSFYPSCDPIELGFPAHLPRIHVQGGLFGARTEILKAYPYSTDQRWVHWGSDIYQSFQLANAGFVLMEVPTVKSVWRESLSFPEQWKYVHDYSEE